MDPNGFLYVYVLYSVVCYPLMLYVFDLALPGLPWTIKWLSLPVLANSAVVAWGVYLVLCKDPRDDFEGVVGPAINACSILVAYAIYTAWLEVSRREVADGFVQTLYGGNLPS